MDRIRKIKETLPVGESLWLVSLEDNARRLVGGRVVNMNGDGAARCIEDGSYRLATDEEAAAQEASDEQKREQARNAKLHPTVRYRGECIVLGPKNPEGQPRAKTGR